MLDNILNAYTNNPILSAFILGLLVSISPCTIATNVTAISFLTDADNKGTTYKKGYIYLLGKALLYAILGTFLFYCVNDKDFAALLQSYFGKIIGPVFLIIGILSLDLIHLHGATHKYIDFAVKYKNNPILPLVTGILLGLAFCPYSGTLFFGALIPLTIKCKIAVLPIIFAIGSSLPIIPIIILLATSKNKLNELKQKFHFAEKISRYFISTLFIISGLLFIYEFYIE